MKLSLALLVRHSKGLANADDSCMVSNPSGAYTDAALDLNSTAACQVTSLSPETVHAFVLTL